MSLRKPSPHWESGDRQRWWVRVTTLAAPFIEKPSLTDPGFPLKVYITNIHHIKKTMVRTQIYLTEHEQSALRQLSRQFKQSQSELIRQAIDRFIEESQQQNRTTILRAAAGLWSDSKPAEDINFQALRAEADRMNPEFRE